jgi:hypothetical protein
MSQSRLLCLLISNSESAADQNSAFLCVCFVLAKLGRDTSWEWPLESREQLFYALRTQGAVYRFEFPLLSLGAAKQNASQHRNAESA